MSQNAYIHWTDPDNINVPGGDNITLFKNTDDNLYYGKLANGTIELIGISASAVLLKKETFNPFNGQTVFVLTMAPIGITNFYVNGALQNVLVDYTVLGNTVTYLNTNFSLTTTDVVTIIYQ